MWGAAAMVLLIQRGSAAAKTRARDVRAAKV
jgi:hypothetical protein